MYIIMIYINVCKQKIPRLINLIQTSPIKATGTQKNSINKLWLATDQKEGSDISITYYMLI